MQVFIFGDNVDTDVIVPGKYLNITSATELARICMEGLDSSLAAQLRPGDIFVAGSNFGCGSSREHAPVAIKGAGIHCVIARSFARIFFRNAINIGLPVLESPEAVDGIAREHEVAVDFSEGRIRNVTTGKEFHFTPFPQKILDIFRDGGLSAHISQKRHKDGKKS